MIPDNKQSSWIDNTDKEEICIPNQLIKLFHYYKHQAASKSKSTVKSPVTVSCDEFQFLRDQEEKMVNVENLEEELDIDHDFAMDDPDLIIMKKKWDRRVIVMVTMQT